MNVIDGTDQAPELRLGVIGLGRAAMQMLPALVHHPNIKITAIVEVNEDIRRRFSEKFQVEAYDNVEDMCKSPQVDAVYIATPHQFHAQQAITAAEHGKNMIVEKPMALTLEDCDTMIEVAEKNGVHLLVGHTHSFNSPVMKMSEIIRSGRLGEVRMINAFNYGDFMYRPRRPEELDTGMGGGIIYNQIPHMIDMVRLLGGGMVRSVRAMAGKWDQSRPTEGAVQAFLEFDNDATASVIYNGYAHFDSDEFHSWIGEMGQQKDPEAYGVARRKLKTVNSPEEEAALKTSSGFDEDVIDQMLRTDTEHYHPHLGELIISCEHGDIRCMPNGMIIYGDEEKEMVSIPPAKSIFDKTNVLDEFYHSVSTNHPLLHDGRWGKATMEVSLAILASSQQKKEIHLLHQVPTQK
jgi:phthalate 4,5-cis-dihydrodiol dehydrogenase